MKQTKSSRTPKASFTTFMVLRCFIEKLIVFIFIFVFILYENKLYINIHSCTMQYVTCYYGYLNDPPTLYEIQNDPT